MIVPCKSTEIGKIQNSKLYKPHSLVPRPLPLLQASDEELYNANT